MAVVDPFQGAGDVAGTATRVRGDEEQRGDGDWNRQLNSTGRLDKERFTKDRPSATTIEMPKYVRLLMLGGSSWSTEHA